jgi:hypothetical protein
MCARQLDRLVDEIDAWRCAHWRQLLAHCEEGPATPTPALPDHYFANWREPYVSRGNRSDSDDGSAPPHEANTRKPEGQQGQRGRLGNTPGPGFVSDLEKARHRGIRHDVDGGGTKIGVAEKPDHVELWLFVIYRAKKGTGESPSAGDQRDVAVKKHARSWEPRARR